MKTSAVLTVLLLTLPFAGLPALADDPPEMEESLVITCKEAQFILGDLPTESGRETWEATVWEEVYEQWAEHEAEFFSEVELMLGGDTTDQQTPHGSNIYGCHTAWANINGGWVLVGCVGSPYDCLCIDVHPIMSQG